MYYSPGSRPARRVPGAVESFGRLVLWLVLWAIGMLALSLAIVVGGEVVEHGLRALNDAPQTCRSSLRHGWLSVTGTIDRENRKQIPVNPYYACTGPKRTDAAGLRRVLQAVKWPVGYARDEFDCSDMAVALEHILEHAGYETDIAAEWKRSRSVTRKHGWVIARTDSGEVHVEPTWSPPEIVPPRRYEKRYRDILQLLRETNVRECDWWESIYIGWHGGLPILAAKPRRPAAVARADFQ